MTSSRWFAARAARFDESFSATVRLTQINVALAALEDLVSKAPHIPPAIAARARPRLARPRLVGARLDSALDSALDARFDRPTAWAALALAGALVIRPQRGAAAATLLALQLGLSVRTYARNVGFGRDGSDHAAIVQQGALVLAAASQTPGVRLVALGFIAMQGFLAYFVSGSVKIASPLWRNGRAITGIARTESYGDAHLHAVLKENPWLARTIAWSVIAGELSMPLLFVLPRTLSKAALAGLLLMHAAIARFMGLNRFFWAFAAMHPTMRAAIDRSDLVL